MDKLFISESDKEILTTIDQKIFTFIYDLKSQFLTKTSSSMNPKIML